MAEYPPGRLVFFGYLCSVSFYDCIIKGSLQYLVFVSYFSSCTPARTTCVYLCARTIETEAPYLRSATYEREQEVLSPFMPVSNIQMILSTERYRIYSYLVMYEIIMPRNHMNYPFIYLNVFQLPIYMKVTLVLIYNK